MTVGVFTSTLAATCLATGLVMNLGGYTLSISQKVDRMQEKRRVKNISITYYIAFLLNLLAKLVQYDLLGHIGVP
jgi:hypothetical protein